MPNTSRHLRLSARPSSADAAEVDSHGGSYSNRANEPWRGAETAMRPGADHRPVAADALGSGPGTDATVG
ncbi:hypothetical protein [Stackebrandtia soli]|uniref:hypothetical protein n=1 Tax=Stackebrandtia soli TaxID=1892856 RepID=UPI0039E91618